MRAQAFSRLPEHDCFAFSPNFGYQLCVKKIKPAERDQLSLSNFVAAINAAEPIRVSTLREFCAFFGPSGAPHLATICGARSYARSMSLAQTPRRPPISH